MSTYDDIGLGVVSSGEHCGCRKPSCPVCNHVTMEPYSVCDTHFDRIVKWLKYLAHKAVCWLYEAAKFIWQIFDYIAIRVEWFFVAFWIFFNNIAVPIINIILSFPFWGIILFVLGLYAVGLWFGMGVSLFVIYNILFWVGVIEGLAQFVYHITLPIPIISLGIHGVYSLIAIFIGGAAAIVLYFLTMGFVAFKLIFNFISGTVMGISYNIGRLHDKTGLFWVFGEVVKRASTKGSFWDVTAVVGYASAAFDYVVNRLITIGWAL